MQAFHFGSPERRLFGFFHPAEAPSTVQRAVLLCLPMGQEAVRSHRLFRVLAQRLARAGLPVLRFDPFGSGDADGDDTQLELQGWADDVLTAARELRRRAPGAALWWIGARLGGTAACLAAGRAGRAGVVPHGLVLCEPVIDGRSYGREIAQATVATLEASCSIKDPDWRCQLDETPQRWIREGVGFAIGDALYGQLERLSPEALAPPAGLPTWLVGSRRAQGLAGQAERWRLAGCAVEHQELPFDFDWNAEEALNTALVPHEMLHHLASLAERGMVAA